MDSKLSPLHVQFEHNECWYVVAGEFMIRVGVETFHARPGKIEAFFKAINEGKLEKMSDNQKNQFRIGHGSNHVGPPLPFSESKMIKPPDAKQLSQLQLFLPS